MNSNRRFAAQHGGNKKKVRPPNPDTAEGKKRRDVFVHDNPLRLAQSMFTNSTLPAHQSQASKAKLKAASRPKPKPTPRPEADVDQDQPGLGTLPRLP